MSTKLPTPIKFESVGNKKEDLAAMQRQLASLQSALSAITATPAGQQALNSAPAKPALYPALSTGNLIMTPAGSVPVVAKQEVPAGFVEDVGDTIRRIMELIHQVTTAMNQIKTSAKESAAEVGLVAGQASPSTALVVAPAPIVRAASFSGVKSTSPQPTFIRALPEKVSSKSKKQAKVAAVAVAPVVAATTAVPKDDMSSTYELRQEDILAARGMLDTAIATIRKDPKELIIRDESEYFCVMRFRKLMEDNAGRASKNFMRDLDKMCGKK